MSETPNNHTIKTDNTGDPYPWLDADDPRRKMTDAEILRSKVPFDKSILSAAEKERLIKLMLENTPAFSIRDEIGTCPYFEVKLKLRDDNLSLLGHTISVKTRSLLFKRKWIGWKS